MRATTIIAIFAALLAAGCSGSNSGTDSSASPSPMPSGTTDKRTGLPVYPGAIQSSTSSSSAGTMTSFMTDDAQKSVASWYKSTLPSTFTETDNSGNSDPTFQFSKTVNGKEVAKVYLTTVGSKTSIDVETEN